MRYLILLILLGMLFTPQLSYSEPVPPDGDECLCNTEELPQSGLTGLEILAEICPGGTLSPDADFFSNGENLGVSLDDPEIEFSVRADDAFVCFITDGFRGIGLRLNETQFQACRETIINTCFERRPIPTISELGLIAMAGVLGLAGLFVIRRKEQPFKNNSYQ